MFKKGKKLRFWILLPPTASEKSASMREQRIRGTIPPGMELDFFCTNLVISARFNVSRETKLMAADSF